jgi:hypothetical protein
MLDKIRTLIDKIKALNEEEIVTDALKTTQKEKFILDLNRKDQLFIGKVDADGKNFGVYSGFTEQINKGETFTFEGYTNTKKAGSPYFLFDTGGFFNSFRVKFVPTGFIIQANDEKIDEKTGEVVSLTEKYGEKIIGLSDESKGKLAGEIMGDVQRKTKEKIIG